MLFFFQHWIVTVSRQFLEKYLTKLHTVNCWIETANKNPSWQGLTGKELSKIDETQLRKR